MIDRERTIRDLETIGAWHTHHYEPFHNECAETIHNALELLKEQEPVAHATWLCEETSTAYDLYGVKTWAAKYKCSKCGSVHRAIEAHMCYSYCPMCGARMDEDAKEGET